MSFFKVSQPSTIDLIYDVIVLVLLLPIILLLNGALFGSWRGSLIAALYAVITAVLAFWPPWNTDGHGSTLWHPSPDELGVYMFALSWPLAALAVGFTYRRRLFRGFWRAFGSASLGMAILLFSLMIAVVLGALVFTRLSGGSPSSETISNVLAGLSLILCISPFYVGLIATLYALIEMALQAIVGRLRGRPPD
jgi:hypothetical protein